MSVICITRNFYSLLLALLPQREICKQPQQNHKQKRMQIFSGLPIEIWLQHAQAYKRAWIYLGKYEQAISEWDKRAQFV